MTLTAEVIVDVPTMQTDQPFTYLVPSEMETALQVGMRVEVPFGNGNRHVQGFVMAIQKSEESANPSLKAVIRLLDLAPVVNEELLSLADYMKKITYAFKITCLQTMLPSVMKAEYDKLIYPLADTPEIQALFGQRESDFLERSRRRRQPFSIDSLAPRAISRYQIRSPYTK